MKKITENRFAVADIMRKHFGGKLDAKNDISIAWAPQERVQYALHFPNDAFADSAIVTLMDYNKIGGFEILHNSIVTRHEGDGRIVFVTIGDEVADKNLS